jgi:hypothetical protein
MEPSIFHQKMKDLKQKLSSINDDIVEIQKNQKKRKSNYCFKENENSSSLMQANDFQIRHKNKSINLENPVYSKPHNDLLYNLTISSETPEATPSKKIFYNRNFYDKVNDLKIKKKLENDLTEETNEINNNNEKASKNTIRNRYSIPNLINEDDEISFGHVKDDNYKIINKLSNVINNNRNPISLRANKKYIHLKNKENNNEQLKIKETKEIKEIINHKYNDNIMINNNNTICITCGNNRTIQREQPTRRKKIIPFHHKNNNLKSNIFNLYSIVSPKNNGVINSKTISFETDINKENNNNKIINSSNNYESIKNENRSHDQYNREEALPDCRFSENLLRVKRIVKNSFNNNNNINNKDIIDIKKRRQINISDNLNRKKVNSISFNKLFSNGNTLANEKSNKIIKIQNKIFNLNEKSKKSYANFDKDKKLILNINKQLVKKRKKNCSFKNFNISEMNILHDDVEGKKNEMSLDFTYKFNRNIVDSKITNNFILKLIKLYHESTGFMINKENDLNSTLTILYNWIENMNKKNNNENKRLNEELQYKMLRQQIMNHYQLRNKNELKSFLTKILGNE